MQDVPHHRRTSPPRIRPSWEVAHHHARLHDRQCPQAEVVELICPCERTTAICCSQCLEAVFFRADDDWCRHAEALSAMWLGHL